MAAPRIDRVVGTATWRGRMYRVEIERMEEEEYESDDDDAPVVTKVWGLAQVWVVGEEGEEDDDAPAEAEVSWEGTDEMVKTAIEKIAG